MLALTALVDLEIVKVCLVDVIGDDVVGVVVLGVAKDLDLLRVGDHDALAVELKSLPEPLHSPLTKADVLVTKLSLRLEKGSNRATEHDLDINCFVLIHLADRPS